MISMNHIDQYESGGQGFQHRQGEVGNDELPNQTKMIREIMMRITEIMLKITEIMMRMMNVIRE